MRFSSVLARPLVWGALALASGCGKKPAAEQANASAAPGLPALPEPTNLLAELAIAQPGATYRALRELGGPVASLLPAGFPMFVATLAGLPPLSADSFDSDVGAVGAVAQRPGSASGVGVVLALHVVSGRELVAKLTTGDHAGFRAQIQQPSGLTVFEPSAAGPGSTSGSPPFVLGVFDNYLVGATDRDLLGSVGPYVARMLPRRPPSKHAITLHASRQALAGAAVPALRALWSSYRITLADQDRAARAAHGGRAPDFGDPAQVILGLDTAAEGVLSVLESAQALELHIDPDTTQLRAALSLTPAAGSPGEALLANFANGNAQGLLALPVETRFALGVTSAVSEREAAAQAAGDDWVRLLGARLSEREAKKLRAALSDWELGHGMRSSYGFVGGAEPGVFVTTEVANAARLERAGHELFGLFSLPAVRAPFAQFGAEPHVSESTVTRSDYAQPVQLAKIVFSSATAKSAPLPPLTCAWLVDDKTASLAASKDAEALLRRVTSAARGAAPALGANAAVVSGVARLGEGAAVYAYADGRIAAGGDSSIPAPAPILIGFGRSEQAALLQAEVSKPAIEIALHRATGF